MGSQDRIRMWIASIVAPKAADDNSTTGPRKRVKLGEEHPPRASEPSVTDRFSAPNRPDTATQPITPPLSASGFSNISTGSQHVMSRSPSKRPWPDEESTPRALRMNAAEDSNSISSSSYTASSRHSGSSRHSPTKQIRHAGLQRTGFRQSSFEFDRQPPSLQTLCRNLRAVYYGDGILPKRLESEFMDMALPSFFFRDDTYTSTRRYPSRHFVRQILSRANECDLDGKGESSWNMDVHARILEWLLEENPNSDACVGSEYCTTAGLLREYKPNGAPSKMIDFCITIRPRRPEDQVTIDAVRSRRPGDSINHTDWGSLSKYPIAISIETKRHGEQYDAALLQIATWHSAQWRSLRWEQEGGGRPFKIEYLSGLIVQGHDWQFVPSILGTDAVSKVVRPPMQIGDTRTEVGILKLIVSLQELKRDAQETFWPAFKADILEAPS